MTTGNLLITRKWQKIVKFNEFALNNVLIDLLTQTHKNVLKRFYGKYSITLSRLLRA